MISTNETVVSETVVSFEGFQTKMKFYDREQEIEKLREIARRSREVAQFTVVTGRRRVGKSSLILKAYEKEPFAYLFVERKSEKDLCEGFAAELESKLGLSFYGTPSRFEDLFKAILKFSLDHPITVVIDEFQEFLKINKSVFSAMQHLWDVHHAKAKINLIVSGSVNTLMQKIFLSHKASLYGRATAFFKIQPFRIEVLKRILSDHSPHFDNDDLLALWTFTGGVAKYVALLMDAGAVTRQRMIEKIVSEESLFIDEGRMILAEEFDKEYGFYFSVLSAIACGRNTRAEISQALGRDCGGYLTRLERDYAIIEQIRPIYARESAKGAHYRIHDRFFSFWFRFVFKYSYLLQIRGYDKLRELIARDYPVFSGFALESYFHQKFVESGEWTRLGNWWDRKGENELDLIAENELDDRLVIAEIKREKSRIDLAAVKAKFEVFKKNVKLSRKLKPEFQAFSIKDM